MDLTTIVLYVLIGAAGIWAANKVVRLVWRIRSEIQRPAVNRLPLDPRAHIWNDPGEVEKLDFENGPGGLECRPRAPFTFLEEHASGSSPNISVEDASGRIWRVKWGNEVNTEAFATRFVWAAGYYAEVTHFLPEGVIQNAGPLTRAAPYVDSDGRFMNARFELEEKHAEQMFDEQSWSWAENPFVGTKELNGLKILVMLLSCWDNKDVRDVARGSNNAIFEYRLPDGSIEARYLITDWGGSMGKWGSNIVSRGRWDCAGYYSQTPDFVKDIQDGIIQWGYAGQRTEDAVLGISVDDVRWLYRYIGRITDEQLAAGLRASGATEEDVACFTAAIRERINILGKISDEADSRQ